MYSGLCRAMCVCGRHQVEEMLAWCAGNPDQRELCSYALLFLFSYSFLLRGPSEALPAVVSGHGHVACTSSMLSIEGDQLVLILKRRKNKPEGSRLARNCSCRKSAASCVYCRLKPLVDAVPQGQRIFPGLTAAGAIVVLVAAWLVSLCMCCCRCRECAEGIIGGSRHRACAVLPAA